MRYAHTIFCNFGFVVQNCHTFIKTLKVESIILSPAKMLSPQIVIFHNHQLLFYFYLISCHYLTSGHDGHNGHDKKACIFPTKSTYTYFSQVQYRLQYRQPQLFVHIFSAMSRLIFARYKIITQSVYPTHNQH